MRSWTKFLLAITCLLLGGVASYLYFPIFRSPSPAAASKPPESPPTPVHTVTVQRGTIQQQTMATGDIFAAARVEVFSKVEGRLQELRVEQGDTVQADQVIARIDDAELKAQVEKATADLDALHADWAQMQAGALPEEIAQAEERVQQTRAELANTERLLERTRAMTERGLQSTQDLEDVTLRVTQARAAHSIAEKRLKLLRDGARAEDRLALQARLRAAQATLRLAQTELQNAVITAPITGIVSHRHVDLGAYIADGTSIVTIVDMDTVKIRVPISERDIGRLRPGLESRLRVDAYPEETFEGTVRRISPTIDPASRSGEVEIVVSNPDYRLKPGMFAKVIIILEQRENVVVVPRPALRMGDTGAAVFVVQDETAHLRQVTTGLRSDTEVEILDSLTPGTEIVLAGHRGLEDQAPIKIIPTKE